MLVDDTQFDVGKDTLSQIAHSCFLFAHSPLRVRAIFAPLLVDDRKNANFGRFCNLFITRCALRFVVVVGRKQRAEKGKTLCRTG